ncbi:elongation factor 4 [bacterium]|nr:elongation factor 4 [bacterium]
MLERIRNFALIAHIDHGKSTLADRILELTGVIPPGTKVEQVLDDMELEREHGVTIKLTPVRINYKGYILNLIDTPGHVDFSYEVSRSLAACEGALLIVDATQGVEAQTVAHTNVALNHNLEIIPILNKIDLPQADPERVKNEIEEMLAIDTSDAILCSAKEGWGVEEVLEAIIERIPPPKGEPEAPLRALIFDSHFDPYLGVIVYVRLFDGRLRKGMKIKMMGREEDEIFEVTQVGVFVPKMKEIEELQAGEVGYFAAGIRNVRSAQTGDTVTEAERPAKEPVPGFRPAKPMVFCGLYPAEGTNYEDLREALEKLRLNDAALTFQEESSPALGIGFHCGFLGLFHMQIIQERLEREFNLHIVATAPSVKYRVKLTQGEVLEIDNPAKFPPPQMIESIEEPFVETTIIVPSDFIGGIMELCKERRGELISMDFPTAKRVILRYEMPLSEIMYDFFDQLKSRSKGFASFDYDFKGYKPEDLVKVDILLNGVAVDALSFIAHREKAYRKARLLVDKLKEEIPRQLFEVRIQAAIGSKVIASQSIKPLRKDVLAKCYGGDVTRKKKLLEKQKEGKKRLKMVGKVEVPQEAFLSLLRIEKKD